MSEQSMGEQSIHARISELVGHEHRLREQAQRGEITTEDEQRQLRETEESLDQCWDLLRQRDGRRHQGLDPDGARARPVSEVEGYIQ